MALAATLVGFGLLVVALVTGTLWLAIACIVVCIVGGVFLLADLLGLGDALTFRRRRSAKPAAVAVDEAESDDDGDAATQTETPEIPDSEITTEFPRIGTEEPVVSLDDAEPAEPARHGRHESDDVAHGPSHPPRHGSPDR